MRLGRSRILIVDDFEPWRHAARIILAEDLNLEIAGECADGLDAVRMCGELRPDLVLLDMHLPVMHGFAVAMEIRAVSPNTKILFVSAFPSQAMMRDAVEQGAGLVAKQDAFRELLPTVRSVLRDEPFLRFSVLSGA
jgi:DNA-binding NarL/FixJ family response regulator